MQKWEYCEVGVNTIQTSEEIKRELDALGALGWELIAIFPVAASTISKRTHMAIFKRPKGESSADEMTSEDDSEEELEVIE